MRKVCVVPVVVGGLRSTMVLDKLEAKMRLEVIHKSA